MLSALTKLPLPLPPLLGLLVAMIGFSASAREPRGDVTPLPENSRAFPCLVRPDMDGIAIEAESCHAHSKTFDDSIRTPDNCAKAYRGQRLVSHRPAISLYWHTEEQVRPRPVSNLVAFCGRVLTARAPLAVDCAGGAAVQGRCVAVGGAGPSLLPLGEKCFATPA